MHIPVSLSPRTTFYDLQKLRYRCLYRPALAAYAGFRFLRFILKVKALELKVVLPPEINKHSAYSGQFEPKNNTLRRSGAEIWHTQYNYMLKMGVSKRERETLFNFIKIVINVHSRTHYRYSATASMILKYETVQYNIQFVFN